MDDAQHYTDKAEQLLQLALTTLKREERLQYLQQAAEWRERAEALKARREAE